MKGIQNLVLHLTTIRTPDHISQVIASQPIQDLLIIRNQDLHIHSHSRITVSLETVAIQIHNQTGHRIQNRISQILIRSHNNHRVILNQAGRVTHNQADQVILLQAEVLRVIAKVQVLLVVQVLQEVHQEVQVLQEVHQEEDANKNI